MEPKVERMMDALKYLDPGVIESFLDRNCPQNSDQFTTRLLKDLDTIGKGFESIADQLAGQTEDQLKFRVVEQLRAFGYNADAEAYCRGRPDITVKLSRLSLKILCEAKKHDGNEYLNEGMLQLLTRYSTGTCSDTVFLVFVFQKKCQMLLDRWTAFLTETRTCNLQGDPVARPDIKLSIETKHLHESSGLVVKTVHLFFALFYEPEDKSARTVAAKQTASKTAKSKPTSDQTPPDPN